MHKGLHRTKNTIPDRRLEQITARERTFNNTNIKHRDNNWVKLLQEQLTELKRHQKCLIHSLSAKTGQTRTNLLPPHGPSDPMLSAMTDGESHSSRPGSCGRGLQSSQQSWDTLFPITFPTPPWERLTISSQVGHVIRVLGLPWRLLPDGLAQNTFWWSFLGGVLPDACFTLPGSSAVKGECFVLFFY